MPFSVADDAADAVIAKVRAALEPLADRTRAEQMQAYMKDVAPFLGISTPSRRASVRPILRSLDVPSEEHLGALVRKLWGLDEREYHYAACDLLAHFNKHTSHDFLVGHVEFLVTTKSWWDTVDCLGSAIITPLVARNQELVATMWVWLRDANIWLRRAAIQHQRGLKQHTDVPRLVAMCEERAADKEFFVAKAVGWALRDLAHLDATAATEFLARHDGVEFAAPLSAVARREAVRGLNAVRAP